MSRGDANDTATRSPLLKPATDTHSITPVVVTNTSRALSPAPTTVPERE